MNLLIGCSTIPHFACPSPWRQWRSDRVPGLFAHPDAPDGGCGSAGSCLPGPYGTDIHGSELPHPQSPIGHDYSPGAAARHDARFEWARAQSVIECVVPEPEVFYRGDKPGFVEFKSYAFRTYGEDYCRELLEEQTPWDLMESHAVGSQFPPSPYVSVTPRIEKACSFAGMIGQVYELRLRPGRVIKNDGNLKPETEYLVPCAVMADEIVRVLPDAEVRAILDAGKRYYGGASSRLISPNA